MRRDPRRLFPFVHWLALAGLLVLVVACGSDAAPDAAASTDSVARGGSVAKRGSVATAAADKPEASAGSERQATVAVEIVTPRPVVDWMRLPADLHAARRALLGALAPGTIVAVHADVGDVVAAGAPLITVDTRVLEQQLAEAEAVDRQRARQLERAQALFERQSITQSQLLDAITERDVAAARLERVRLELENSRLVALWTGTVSQRLVEVGDFVARGQGVIEMLDLSPLIARAPVPARDVPALRLGMPARLRVDALPDRVVEGVVSRLGAALDPDARTLEIEVEIPAADGLRPGMSGRLELPRRSLDDALVVPRAAVLELEDGLAVYVVEGERVTRRRVSLGPEVGDGRIVVTDGLAPGDAVVVAGQRTVSAGQRVVVESTDRTPTSGGTRDDPAP